MTTNIIYMYFEGIKSMFRSMESEYLNQIRNVLGMASMTITCREQAPSKRISSLLRERLIDEQVEAEVKCYPASFSGDYQYWRVHFYYTPAYVVENFYPKDE